MAQIFQLPKVTPLSVGRVLSGAKLTFYLTATTTLTNVYTDDDLSVPHSNPVVADANGVFAPIYLNPEIRYKATLTTSADVLFYTVDPVNDSLPTQAQIGAILYPRTAAELAAGVTPTNYAYEPYVPPRYGSAGDATTDDAAAIQREIDSCIAAGSELDLWGTTSNGYRINSTLQITGKLKIRGNGYGKCGIIAVGCDAFNISAGLLQVELEGFRINQATRYTTTPNAYTAIKINGTTASACVYHKYHDLFIDGFETPIKANGVHQSDFENIIAIFGKHGIIAEEKTVNNRVRSCQLSGSDTGSYGLKIGDGISSTEGWTVSDTLLYGFSRGVWAYGSNNSKIHHCFIDFFTEYGVILQSGAAIAATNWVIDHNYMAATGSSASTGIRCLNSVASSDPRGNRIIDNDILVYSGQTLARGIFIDGTQETYNLILGNRCRATTYDCNITSGTTHIVANNHWLNGGYIATVRNAYFGNIGANISNPNVAVKRLDYMQVRTDPTYGATIAIDCDAANESDITVTNNSNFTISNPSGTLINGMRISITIRNSSGGAMGTITWDTAYKLAAWTNPATGFSRTIDFKFNGSVWVEMCRTSADVPN